MSAKAKEQSAQPLGVIGCLTAGFEMVGRGWWLIALPALVDLFLWLGPRLSVAPLVRGFAAILQAQSTADPGQVRQMGSLLEQFGERFNLFSLLSALPLLNIPSLLGQHAPGMLSPLSDPSVFVVTNMLVLIGWGMMLLPAGLVLGLLYLDSLAWRVRAAWTKERDKAAGKEQNVSAIGEAGRMVRVLIFAVGLVGTGMVLFPVWVMVVGMAAAISQSVGFLVSMLSLSFIGYLALHLLFVVHGILLGGRGLLRAIWESVVLIHTQLPSVVGLVLLVALIYKGLGYIWSLPSGDSWALLIGILCNSLVATALTAATFVFYQERIGLLPVRQSPEGNGK